MCISATAHHLCVLFAKIQANVCLCEQETESGKTGKTRVYKEQLSIDGYRNREYPLVDAIFKITEADYRLTDTVTRPRKWINRYFQERKRAGGAAQAIYGRSARRYGEITVVEIRYDYGSFYTAAGLRGSSDTVAITIIG